MPLRICHRPQTRVYLHPAGHFELPEENIQEENLPSTVEESNNRVKELENNKKRLKNVHQKLEEILTSHADIAMDFGKARDVEVLSGLGKTLVEVNREIRETTKDIYGKGEQENNNTQQKNVQNNIYFGDTREILEAIDKEEDEDKNTE